MGERYDAVVTLKDGVFPLVAEPVGKAGLARALVRTGAGTAPASSFRPATATSRGCKGVSSRAISRNARECAFPMKA